MTPTQVMGFDRARKQAMEWIDSLPMDVGDPVSRKYKLELRQELYRVDWQKYDATLPDISTDLDQRVADVARTLIEKPKWKRKSNG